MKKAYVFSVVLLILFSCNDADSSSKTKKNQDADDSVLINTTENTSNQTDSEQQPNIEDQAIDTPNSKDDKEAVSLNPATESNSNSTHPQQSENPFGSGGSGSNDGFGEGSGSGVSVSVAEYSFHEYMKLNALLSTYVSSSGKVNYGAIKNHKSELDAIIKEFEKNYPEGTWSNHQKLAYWINAYNVYTIKLIVDNYPTTSITKITAKPWDKKFINLGGKSYSLNNIENDIIRKQFNEPRIHFALNCASESCPILLNKAYKAAGLSSQLTAQTKKFLNDTSKNTFTENTAQISKIFEWYKGDFDTSGGVMAFINKYRSSPLNNPTITYLEYSWDLND